MKMSHWMLTTLTALSLMAGVHAAEAPAKQEATNCCAKACVCAKACDKACAETCACKTAKAKGCAGAGCGAMAGKAATSCPAK